MKGMGIVNVKAGGLSPDRTGDFIRCTDCGALSLAEKGIGACPKCKSPNLSWALEGMQECGVPELEAAGYGIQYV